MAESRLWLRFTLIVIIVTVWQHGGSNWCASGVQVWRKINGEKVCFGATDGMSGQFHSLYTINVAELRYVRRSGYLECSDLTGGYFGCEPYPLQDDGRTSGHPPPVTAAPANPAPGGPPPVVAPTQAPLAPPNSGGQVSYYHHHHHYYHHHQYPPHQSSYQYGGHSRYYNGPGGNSAVAPKFVVHMHDSAEGQKNDEEGKANDIQYDDNFIKGPGPASYQGVTVFLADSSGDIILPQPPHPATYFTIPGVNRPAWNPSITIPIAGAPIAINQGMELHLYHGEDFSNNDMDNNSGQLCVDVYAYGSMPSPAVTP